MKFSTTLATLLVSSASWVLVSGCGDDDDANGGTGGTAQTGGAKQTGGSGQTGGAKQTGGSGQTGGAKQTGGSGNAGGSGAGGASGGSAQQGGSSGKSGGSPGASGAGAGGDGGGSSGGPGDLGGAGSGGEAGAPSGGTNAGGSGGDGGWGGDAGAGGSGGAKGDETVAVCHAACDVAADCYVNGAAAEATCNLETHRCEGVIECMAHDDCLTFFNFWTECSDDSECTDSVCIDVSGRGYCAPLESEIGDCNDLFAQAVTRPRFGASGTATVCADSTGRCSEQLCILGCTGAAECPGAACNVETGLCGCLTDATCTEPGLPHCNVASGRCECSASSDCVGVTNSNVCVSGRCGCSDASACTTSRYDSTTFACE